MTVEFNSTVHPPTLQCEGYVLLFMETLVLHTIYQMVVYQARPLSCFHVTGSFRQVQSISGCVKTQKRSSLID